MGIPLGQLSPRATSSDPTDLLLECHERIRMAMRQAEAIVAAADGDPGIAPTAASVHRYFSVALPLHAADEDESLAPRLWETGLPERLLDVVAAITPQHVAIDAVLARLLPAWERLAKEPQALADLRTSLQRDTAQLDALWVEHLDLEERVVFPLIGDRLAPAVRADIVREMRDRRGVRSVHPTATA